MRAPSVIPYGDALRAIRAHCADPYRSSKHLDDAHAALTKKSQSTGFTPSARDEAARSAETISLFQIAANPFGLGKLPFFESPRLTPVNIQDVTVSVQPDLLIGTAFPPTDGKIGGAFFRPQKRPDPAGCKTEKTRSERQEFRREMGRYMTVLLRMTLIENGVPEDKIDPKWLLFFDLRLHERIEMPTDRISRERRIKAACGQISRLWAGVEPKPGDLGTGE